METCVAWLNKLFCGRKWESSVGILPEALVRIRAYLYPFFCLPAWAAIGRSEEPNTAIGKLVLVILIMLFLAAVLFFILNMLKDPEIKEIPPEAPPESTEEKIYSILDK